MDTQSSNDSIFSGGDNAVITKVMGGGGEGVAPPGYNDTQTVFDPDIGGKEAELIMVTGGGPSPFDTLRGYKNRKVQKVKPPSRLTTQPVEQRQPVQQPGSPKPPGPPRQPVLPTQSKQPTQTVVPQPTQQTQTVVPEPIRKDKNIRIIKNYTQKGNLIKYNDFITKIEAKKGQIITSLEKLLEKNTNEQKDLHYALNNEILENSGS